MCYCRLAMLKLSGAHSRPKTTQAPAPPEGGGGGGARGGNCTMLSPVTSLRVKISCRLERILRRFPPDGIVLDHFMCSRASRTCTPSLAMLLGSHRALPVREIPGEVWIAQNGDSQATR